MSYRIAGLNPAEFLPLFNMPDEELAARRAKRVVATGKPGFPCRITLEDAEPGEELVLLNYEHQPAASPFRSAHAIYVRRAAAQPFNAVDTLPPVFRNRMISLRGFDVSGEIVAADLVRGEAAAEAIERLFENGQVAYLHAHYAMFGCFAARIDRVE